MKTPPQLEIKSHRIFSAIQQVQKDFPKAIFGGSISLRAFLLITREINDIDIFSFLDIKTIEVEGSGDDKGSNGVIKQDRLFVEGVDVCHFHLCALYRLEPVPCKVMHNEVVIEINLQHPRFAIEAKRQYVRRLMKHQQDLFEIEGMLFNQCYPDAYDKIITELPF